MSKVVDEVRDDSNESQQFLNELLAIGDTIKGSCQSLLERVKQVLYRAIYCIVGSPKEDAVPRIPNELPHQNIPATKGKETG